MSLELVGMSPEIEQRRTAGGEKALTEFVKQRVVMVAGRLEAKPVGGQTEVMGRNHGAAVGDAAEIQGFNRGIVERAERIGTSPHNDAEEIFQADAVLHDFMDHSGSRNLRKRAVGETVHSHLVHGYVIQGLHLGFGQAAVNLAFRENGSFRREQAGIQVKRGADAMRIENGNQLLILLDTVVITEGQRKKPTVRKTNIHGSSSP